MIKCKRCQLEFRERELLGIDNKCPRCKHNPKSSFNLDEMRLMLRGNLTLEEIRALKPWEYKQRIKDLNC